MTTSAALATERSPHDLNGRWRAFRAANPKVRIRDAADRLGVSEAELVALGCGTTTTRLAGAWGELVQSLPGIGRVMALSRNDNAVHERRGTFGDVQIHGTMGLVLGEDIDLRLFLGQWRHGFALREPVTDGERRSLQFFDRHGRAVHKIYAEAETDLAALDSLIERFRGPDQSIALEVEPAAAAAEPLPDTAIDVDGLRSGWNALKDTHDFFALLKRFKVQRRQALRLVGEPLARAVPTHAMRAMLEAAAARDVSIMVFVGNPGIIQIHSGPVRNLKATGPWFNVLDPDFNLHLREDRVDAAWVVRKPTVDGIVTSIEIFDAAGDLIVQFFGKRKPGLPENEGWRAIVADLEKAVAA